MHPDARAKAWATRRAKYGQKGHAGSYSRTREWGARRIAESLAINWILDMHNAGQLSEGQCCARLNMERVAFRKMVDDWRAKHDPAS